MIATPDTIYAVATPRGRGALALIRLSGPQCRAVIHVLAGSVPAARRATVMTLRHHGEVLDQAVVTFYATPASFTGEDVAELSLHGGRAVLGAVIAALADQPETRPAEPGEFTRRAFLNGKIDLTGAEAIADLIDAETTLQRRQALTQLGGAQRDLYEGWRSEVVAIAALLTAALDFADEEVPADIALAARPRLDRLIAALDHHLADNRRGERIRDGASVVLVGAPNVGKSSLLNALAGREAAIVSPQAGTTRDVLDLHLELGGYAVTLTDTAGLRERLAEASGADAIEAEGIKRALTRAAAADIRLVVIDGETMAMDDHTRVQLDDNAVVVVNKADRLTTTGPLMVAGRSAIMVSAQTGQGLADLTAAVIARLEALSGSGDGAVITRVRHREALGQARAALAAALDHGAPEMQAEEVRIAGDAIARLTGRIDVEDILDVVFRDFCIGK